MAPEPQMKQMLAGITTKQKIVAVLFVIVLLIIIWQVKGLFGGGGKPAEMPRVASTARQSSVTTGAPTVQTPEIKQTAVPVDNQFMRIQQETEQQYLSKDR